MAAEPEQIEQLARGYTEAWCSRDPARVAAHYVPGGTIAINGGDAAGIEEVAQGFVAAFPDIKVFMDDLVRRDDERGRVPLDVHRHGAETGQSVRVPGFEEWTISADGLIADSLGHFDQAEYDRQLREGA